MILITQQLEIKPYQPEPVDTHWVKSGNEPDANYCIVPTPVRQAAPGYAGRRNRKPELTEDTVKARITMLESGAVLASFPLLSRLPGSIMPDAFTTWFVLDAPALLSAGVFGREVRIHAGRHLMAPAPGSWVVLFKPAVVPHERYVHRFDAFIKP